MGLFCFFASSSLRPSSLRCFVHLCFVHLCTFFNALSLISAAAEDERGVDPFHYVDVIHVPNHPPMLLSLIPTLVMALVYWRVVKSFPGGLSNVLGNVKPATSNKVNVKFADVAGEFALPAFCLLLRPCSWRTGCVEAKADIMEAVNFLKHPEKYKALGARIPKGTLLVGPPGTGKVSSHHGVPHSLLVDPSRQGHCG
jgi:hypothetical protein